MKKILINTFALIGFVTFILLACSVDEIADSSDNNNNNSETVSNNYGKYQMSTTQFSNAAGNLFHVLDTETGEVRTYSSVSQNNDMINGSYVDYTLVLTTQTF